MTVTSWVFWTTLFVCYVAFFLKYYELTWREEEFEGVTMFGFEPTYVRVAAMLIMAIIFGVLGWMLIGTRRRTVEFLIATEGEMRKVNWSSRREIELSTRAVIGLTILIALYCWAFDVGFASIFRWMTVLRTG